jgi:hypothetical protein
METINDNTKCGHTTLEPIGGNRGMVFLLCSTCRSVIVTQGGTALAIPPVRPAADSGVDEVRERVDRAPLRSSSR